MPTISSISAQCVALPAHTTHQPVSTTSSGKPHSGRSCPHQRQLMPVTARKSTPGSRGVRVMAISSVPSVIGAIGPGARGVFMHTATVPSVTTNSTNASAMRVQVRWK